MWIIYALGASVLWGLTYVLNEQVYKKISVVTWIAITALAVFIATILMAFFSNNLKPDLLSLASSKRLLFYEIGSIVTLLIAELCIGASIAGKNATVAALVEVSYPLFVALFSYILFRNHVSWPTIIGGIIIFVGIFVVYYFNR